MRSESVKFVRLIKSLRAKSNKNFFRILIIDDDNELYEMATEFLYPEGFVVGAVNEGESGLQQALSGEHSLIILDVMLPGMSGFELLQNLGKTSSIQVLMLTARSEDIDRILGLEMGGRGLSV